MLLAASIQEPSKAALGVYGGRGDPAKQQHDTNHRKIVVQGFTTTVGTPQRNLRECVPRHCTNFGNGLSQDTSPQSLTTPLISGR